MNIKKIIIALVFILGCLLINPWANQISDKAKEVEPIIEVQKEIPVKDISKVDIVKQIANTFPENKEVMVAIALEESALNPKAIGYNCYYKLGGDTIDSLTKNKIDLNSISKTKQTGYVSTFCRKEHRDMAWSTDGGIMGIHKATTHEMSVNVNIQKAREIYNTQGINAWSSYTTGRYKDNLVEAKRLLELI
jgi:hypothetical protein